MSKLHKSKTSSKIRIASELIPTRIKSFDVNKDFSKAQFIWCLILWLQNVRGIYSVGVPSHSLAVN